MNLFPCIFVEQLKLSILAFYANRVILTEFFFLVLLSQEAPLSMKCVSE